MPASTYLFLTMVCPTDVDSGEKNTISGAFTNLAKAMAAHGKGCYLIMVMKADECYPPNDPWTKVPMSEYRDALVWFPNDEAPNELFTELLKAEGLEHV